MNSHVAEQAKILREFSAGIGSVAIPATYTAQVAAALLDGAEALEILKQIIGDLPTNRDWLDPVLEARAKKVTREK